MIWFLKQKTNIQKKKHPIPFYNFKSIMSASLPPRRKLYHRHYIFTPSHYSENYLN